MNFFYALLIGLSVHSMIYAHEKGNWMIELLALICIVGILWGEGLKDERD